ncbi:MAG: tyrosine-type recombinase/integrase [Desulfobacteraceae bacterium]|jgi:site-specific recombinase XerD
MKNFESFLAPLFNEYLTYRNSLGYKIKITKFHLMIFDQYLRKTNADLGSLKPFFFLEMSANIEMEPRSINRMISTVRVFFQFLLRRGLVEHNPLRDIPFLKENSINPFVFSHEQTCQLIKAVCKNMRKSDRYFLTDFAEYLVILLLARCGMRISEPLKLMKQHYCRDDATIFIEKTKFKKQRLIPIPRAVQSEIENYLVARKCMYPNDRNPYLLAGKGRNPIGGNRIRYVFHKAEKDMGLDQPRKIIGNVNFNQPTPHSLRHSFAVNTLLDIKKRGQSPQNALPVLAAYMGHAEYKYTSVYLRVMDAMSRKKLVNFSLWQKRKE